MVKAKAVLAAVSALALCAQAKFNLVSSNDIDLFYTDLSEEVPLIDRLLRSTFLSSAHLPQYTCNKVKCLKLQASCDPANPSVEPCLYGYFCNATDEKCLVAAQPGENCTKDTDCADYLSGAYCDTKLHECTTPLTVDSPCSNGSRCPFHATCSAESGVCESNYTLGYGKACGDDIDAKCKINLICEAGLCTNPPTLGEACNESSSCRPPYYCSPSRGVCVDLMSLNESEQCASSVYCEEDLICSRDGVCVKKSTKDFGECSAHSDCPADSYCSCDYDDGKQKCKLLPKSSEDLKESFKLFAYCANRQPDGDILRCAKEALEVYAHTNSDLLRGSCTEDPSASVKKNPPAADLLVPIAFMIVLLIFIGIVLYDSKKSEKKKTA